MALPRIDNLEVVSFSLTLPTVALEQLVRALQAELPLFLKRSERAGTVTLQGGKSRLRFRVQGTQATLGQIEVREDTHAQFFEKVLCILLTEFQGSMHARLRWNDSDRNTQGEYAEVVVHQGQMQGAAAPQAGNVVASSAHGSENPFPSPEGTQAEAQPSTEEVQIEKLLSEGKAHWEEYQRLKSRGAK
jgi:hypothetical protein